MCLDLTRKMMTVKETRLNFEIITKPWFSDDIRGRMLVNSLNFALYWNRNLEAIPVAEDTQYWFHLYL